MYISDQMVKCFHICICHLMQKNTLAIIKETALSLMVFGFNFCAQTQSDYPIGTHTVALTDFTNMSSGCANEDKCFTKQINQIRRLHLLHFVAFFHVAPLFSTGVDNEKVGVDNEKALELDNRIFFFHISAKFQYRNVTRKCKKTPCCIVV